MGVGCSLIGVDGVSWGQPQPYWAKHNPTGVGATFGVSCNPTGPGALPVLISSRGVGGVGGKTGSVWPGNTPGLGAAPGDRAHAHGEYLKLQRS